MSVYPQYEANSPTNAADRGLVDLGSQFFLPIEFLVQWKKVCVGAEGGYYFAQYGPNSDFYGAYIEYQPVDNLDLLAEIHGEDHPDIGISDWLYNFGVRVHYNDRYTLLASVGSALGGTAAFAPDLIAYLGVQFDLDLNPNAKEKNEPAAPRPQAGWRSAFPPADLASR